MSSVVATKCMAYETRIARQGSRRGDASLAKPTVDIHHTETRAAFQTENCDRCEGQCARSIGFRRRNGIQ